MNLFLAVDGGQTATKALLADEKGQILSRATAGPSNHTEEAGGPERLTRVVNGVISSLLEKAGIAGEHEFAAACFGMTGETRIKARVLRGLLRTTRLTVVHDSVNALAGASAGGAGIIVISGTGSVARGRDVLGHEMRVGGWGHLFGDEGSAYWIGREAVRAIAAEEDQSGPDTALSRLLLDRLHVESASPLMEMYYSGQLTRDHLASLSTWVSEAAAAGDSVAEAILREAGRLLAELALAVVARLFRGEEAGATVCYTGGVFENAIVISSFRNALMRRCPQLEIRPPLFPPVFGSLLLAYRSAGVSISGAVRQSWTDLLATTSNAQDAGGTE